ncbi:MAG: SLBB domain-containing protein [Campylobacterales bacterium]|nr:SLBB domain-containing protein [Campylobacterales bacterium]
MKFLKIIALYMMLVLSVNAEDIGGMPSASIVQAIKANPNILNSPQAQQAMQQKGVTASEVLQKVDQVSKPAATTPTAATEKSTNKVDIEQMSDDNKSDTVKDKPVVIDADMTQIYHSPLTVEKTSDYAKRLLSRQIKGQASALQRYGFEFFSNKNGMDLSSLPVPESYRLVPKDVLSVILYGPKSDNMSLTVDKEGNIIIPSFGPLHIAGLSFGDAKKTISDALMAAFPNVGVTVNITQFSTIQVTLAGEVATPGIYNVSSFSTVKEALISAGGLSKNGSMRSVLIKRGGRVYKDIDLYTIIRGSGRSDPLLQAGDIIVVPVMGKSVVIDGDVKRPAIYEAKSNTTIGELIYLAGGLSAEANKNDIRITRYEAHQRMSALNVSLIEAKKMVAMDKDSVYVHGLDRSNLRGITLYGNIVKPGFWPLPKEGMGLRDFFKQEIAQNTLRGVFLEDTYFDYAIIKRIKSNLKEEIIGFSLAKVLNGEEKISLYSRDQLFILNRSTVTPPSIVKISGECIARPGEYRFFDKMTFESLMSTVGTTCPIDRSKVTIVSPDPVAMTLKVRVVDTLQKKSVPLKEFDDIRTIGFFTTNPIKQATISGEVYKPATYPISEATTLKDIILAAGGLTKYTFLDRARITRTLSDDGKKFSTQDYFISVRDLDADAAGFGLTDKDVVTIYNIDELTIRSSVTVNGEVYKPGSFQIDENTTTLKDVILAAGNLTDKASQDKLEIIRYVVVDGIRTRQVQNMTVAQAMSDSSPLLTNYDEVTIFRIPKWNERKSVKIMGKVNYPGEYAVEDGDRLSDLIRRAGGFTESAYTKAAVFTREELKQRQQEGAKRQIKSLEDRMLFAASQPTQTGQNPADKMQTVNMITMLKEEVEKTVFAGRLSIRLDSDLQKFQGSNSDVVLKNGDALYIPEKDESVIVQGEVLNPNATIYNASFSIDDYIEKSGGIKEGADTSNIFVVHSNGDAEPRSRGFFSANAAAGPGDVVIVPMKINTVSGIQFAKDITAIIYQMAVSVAALHTIGSI